MSSFHQVLVGGYPSGGLTTDRKPLMLADEAWSLLQNAYVWRERTKKREGIVGMGRLSRTFSGINFFTTGFSALLFNLLVRSGYVLTANNANPGQVTTTYPHGLTTGDKVVITGIVGATGYNNVVFTITVVDALNFTIGTSAAGFGSYLSGGFFISNRALGTNEPNAQVAPGSFSIIIGANTYTDDGNGNIIDGSMTVVGSLNYITGAGRINIGGLARTIISYTYYPALQSMGIFKRDVAGIGIDQTVFFDTKYAYQFISGGFQELAPGTIWTAANQSNGTNTNFFWTCNYQGATPDLRYFFATNDNITSGSSTPFDPLYYYNNSTWNVLQPIIFNTPATNYLFQALILIPYYGRLIAFNTWEGTSVSSAVNYPSRCRFSQIGNPINNGSTGPYVPSSWATDVFGVGGFLDAPTNEIIVGAAFFRNTLIVFFEYSVWQLRYVGEYGLPFIFERISSDFGSVSTFSSIIFDAGVMAVSGRGIIQVNASGLKRLDEQIPETVFSFEVQVNAPDFVHGVRDFEKELVYWNYIDTSSLGLYQVFPNNVLLLNYRNNTWAQFRDTITCFGTGQFQFGLTWDSLTTFWESAASWDNVDEQEYAEYVTAGNQQGFIFVYENPDVTTPVPAITQYAPTLAITAVNFNSGTSPVSFTCPNHNLNNDEIIYITGALFTPTNPGINNVIYKVSPVDQNTFTLYTYVQATNSYVVYTNSSTSTYIGNGVVALFPKMNMQGKDFNPFQKAGNQFKLSFVDFQMDANLYTAEIPAISIQLFVNSYLNEQANMQMTNMNIGNSNQELLNSSQQYGLISFVSTTAPTSNPCQVTSMDHSLQNGAVIYIENVVGTTQLNNVFYTISVVDANTFSLNGIDSTAFTAYVSGGNWYTDTEDGQSYTPGAQYAWYRFYSTQYGQYLRLGITYDDFLMNQLGTHQTLVELNALNFWFRQGGRLVN